MHSEQMKNLHWRMNFVLGSRGDRSFELLSLLLVVRCDILWRWLVGSSRHGGITVVAHDDGDLVVLDVDLVVGSQEPR